MINSCFRRLLRVEFLELRRVLSSVSLVEAGHVQGVQVASEIDFGVPFNFSFAGLADMNGDGSNDLVYASTRERLIAWYPNVGGEGDFGERQLIPISDDIESKGVGSLHVVDIDGDGDRDVVSRSTMLQERT